MANTINNWNTYCGCSGKSSSCDNVFKKVDELPTLGDATRDNAYILPDNTVWVVDTEGTGFTRLNDGTGETYDDTAIKDRLDALEDKTDNDTTYTAGTGISISADNVISATGGGSSYDDTAIKDRLEALEDCVIEEGGRQVVNITDQVKTYDEPLVVEDRTFDKYVDITFEGTNAIPGTEDIQLQDFFGPFNIVVDKGDGSEPTPYFDSFGGEVLFKSNYVSFDPSKTTRISLNSQEFGDDSVDINIIYETAGGCLSERVEAIEAVLRNLGYM